jgi:hypothetical protein
MSGYKDSYNRVFRVGKDVYSKAVLKHACSVELGKADHSLG